VVVVLGRAGVAGGAVVFPRLQHPYALHAQSPHLFPLGEVTVTVLLRPGFGR
jgi:hypothetical protein